MVENFKVSSTGKLKDGAFDSARVQFSILSLMTVVTVICLLLAPYHWLGGGYLFAMFCSVLLIGSTLWSYSSTRSIALGIFVSILGIPVGFMIVMGTISTLLCSLANLGGCLVWALCRPTTSNLAIILCTVGLVPYALMLDIGWGIREPTEKLAAKYPTQSLVKRLDFDQRSPPTSAITLSADSRASLVEFEQNLDRWDWRIHQLRRIHDETYWRFTIAAGFGSLRMAEVDEYSLKGNPGQVIRLPLRISDSRLPLKLSVDSFKLHDAFLLDYFSEGSLGWVNSIESVAGFDAHGPDRFRSDYAVVADNDADGEWQLTRLELVSLLRHDEPRVYIAETIPLMNELESVPHRALNDFEAAALPRLKTERDTVIEETPHGTVMLGAIRAASDCLECHSGPRGKLLGAFSYELRRIGE